MINRNPIFIVGTPRSGTTLTAKILGRHSNLFMPGETHFFDDIYCRRSELGNPKENIARERVIKRLSTLYGRFNEPSDQERINILIKEHYLKERIFKQGNSYLEILNLFMKLQTNYMDKKRWGNNTPRDIFNVKEIVEFYPKAQVIVCVRDIRDFLLSYQGKWRATSEQEVERLKKLYHPIITSLLWKSSMKSIPAITALVPEEKLFFLKYEDLVLQPEKMIKKICTFLDEKYEPEMLKVTSANTSHNEGKKGIFTTSVHKWKEILSNEEVIIAQKIAGKEMQRLEYKLEKITANPIKIIGIYLSTPFALLRGLAANKEKRGHLLPYLIKRIRSFLP